MTRIWTVVAFGREPFRGNVAAVLEPAASWPDHDRMQEWARELALPATVFLRETGKPERLGLRWFSPARELPLCGHGTLAAAHVVLRQLPFSGDAVEFVTLAGSLEARVSGDKLEMVLPPDRPEPVPLPDGIGEALGARAVAAWRGRSLAVELSSERAVRRLTPDIVRTSELATKACGSGNFGVFALRAGGAGPDAVSRYFTPDSGKPEDSATGSIHSLLGPIAAEKLGRSRIWFEQAYPGRGANLRLTVEDDRVLLAGEAATIVEGRLRFPPNRPGMEAPSSKARDG